MQSAAKTTSDAIGNLQVHWRMLILLSAALLILPGVFVFVKLAATDLAENRVLAGRPATPRSLAALKAYPRQLDDYIRDNFPLRANLIGWSNSLRYLLGYSGSKLVLVGKDGWLFYDDGNHLKFWRGLRLSPPELAAWITSFRAHLDNLKKKNIKLYLFYPPYKETVYPEQLPAWLRVKPKTELDQLLDGLRNTGLNDYVVDTRKQLLAAKGGSNPVYFKFDTHWNSYGAYIGYRELMSRMQKDFPDLMPLPLTNFPLRKCIRCGGDLASMLGIGNFVPDTLERGDTPDSWATTEWLTARRDWAAPHIVHTGRRNGRILLLARDSYGSLLLPFLTANFKTIITCYVVDQKLREELIDRYHPDVVVIESIENYCSLFQ